MNENIDLTKILKDCPKGQVFYSPMCGRVLFDALRLSSAFPIAVQIANGETALLTKEGKYYEFVDAECVLFPSKDQRDWNKFKAPCKKTGHFDPKTLQPFDRVLVRHSYAWRCELLSHYREYKGKIDFYCTSAGFVYSYCIPYNEDTKHLVDTTYEAPEYYRYWEE